MSHLELQVPPQVQVQVADGVRTLDVRVTASPTVFKDHEQFVTCALFVPGEKKPRVEETRVRATDASVQAWVVMKSADLVTIFNREIARRRKLRGF